MRFASLIVLIALLQGLHGCASNPDKRTLAQLRNVEPDVEEVRIDDSLDKAMASYRRFLEETPTNTMTPEAMRRLADLQIEKQYGLLGDGVVTFPAPEAPEAPQAPQAPQAPAGAVEAGEQMPAAAQTSQMGVDATRIADLSETESDFERRATEGQAVAFDADRIASPGLDPVPDALDADPLAGPRQAIETYQRILTEYPYYERNDQVLYQMARAYDELGEPTKAMEVMQRLIDQYGQSAYTDEVYFRRAEYFFVRKKYLDAEDAYSAVVAMGSDSDFYELALYKLGWSFYKQELYEEALHQYMALLDYKMSIGYDFDQIAADGEGDDERRVADTFRVISLGFSNLGGPEILNEYFASHGHRAYEDRIYSNLGEFYLTKLRYNDAATVYRSFVEPNPFHKASPHFSMRVVEIYAEGGFAQLVVESKKEFSTRYGLNSEYWNHFDVAAATEVLSYLKTNLKDLANHYHALYQVADLANDQPENYVQALQWYREFLGSFPEDNDSPPINYQLADLLLEHQDFEQAAREYERTAYEYPAHEQASAAGYAAIYAHRENLKVVGEQQHSIARRATVDSSLRFADTFADHEHAATVLGSAAQDLYEMQDFGRAIAAATQLIERHADADASLRRAAWTVVAHSSFDVALYGNAELAYSQVLGLTPEDDESRQALFDNLAASIYKQGELANVAENHRAAADHFLRIKTAAPTSGIRASAEYDGAAALMKIEDWTAAAEVLRDFRQAHTDHELQPEVTKQLAFVYRQDGKFAQSAQEYERVAADSDDPKLRGEAMLLAGELFEQAHEDDRALAVYERYIEAFPSPIEPAVETRFKVAQMHKQADRLENYHEQLRQIVAIDASAGSERTGRTRLLAARSSLVLSQGLYERFAELGLSQPFEESLAEKQNRMDTALKAFEALVDYEVAEVTAAATFYMAEIYGLFGQALLESERPTGMNDDELLEYELVLEAEAFPFEERTISVHEKNLELMVVGTFNGWIQQSLDRLAVLMPGRYAKHEISSGFIGPVEVFAYRSPGVDTLQADPGNDISNKVESETVEPDAQPAVSESVEELEGVGDVSAAF